MWLPVLSAAAIAAGCGSRGTSSAVSSGSSAGWQTCVDNNNLIADEKACENERRTSHSSGYVPMYHWYYYPFGGRPYPVGYGIPLGGHHSPIPFTGIRTQTIGVPATGAAVPRATYGGFGSTGAGHSSAS
jgi:hypothetical protein